jgi:hypothetical protein
MVGVVAALVIGVCGILGGIFSGATSSTFTKPLTREQNQTLTVSGLIAQNIATEQLMVKALQARPLSCLNEAYLVQEQGRAKASASLRPQSHGLRLRRQVLDCFELTDSNAW